MCEKGRKRKSDRELALAHNADAAVFVCCAILTLILGTACCQSMSNGPNIVESDTPLHRRHSAPDTGATSVGSKTDYGGRASAITSHTALHTPAHCMTSPLTSDTVITPGRPRVCSPPYRNTPRRGRRQKRRVLITNGENVHRLARTFCMYPLQRISTSLNYCHRFHWDLPCENQHTMIHSHLIANGHTSACERILKIGLHCQSTKSQVSCLLATQCIETTQYSVSTLRCILWLSASCT